MRIAIGSDHAGFDLKEEAKAFLLEENHEILDVGTYSKAPVDYPDYAEAVATALREYRAERASFFAAAAWARRWRRIGFPVFAPVSAMTPTRRTRARSLTW